MLGEIVTNCFDVAKGKQKVEGDIKLDRGFAAIALPFPLPACEQVSSHSVHVSA